VKRTLSVFVGLSLLLAACGGDASPPEREGGIAALDETPGAEPTAGAKKQKAADDRKKSSKKKSGDRGKSKPRQGSKASSEETVEEQQPAGEAPEAPGVAAAAPVPSGRYDYATDGQTTVSGNRSAMPSTTTLTAAKPDDGLQRQIRDLRDPDGNGTVTETHLLYRQDGVFLSYVKVTATFSGGLTDVREFRLPQPQLIAPTGGKPGFTRSFWMQGSGTRARVEIAARRFEKVQTSSGSVRSLVVDTVITFSGALEGEQRSTSWFWPKHVLMVQEKVTTDVRNGPVRFQSDYEARLSRTP
jgi:hypothetical protein